MTAAATSSPATSARPEWAKARRIVVKIGSSLLVDQRDGRAQRGLARIRSPPTSPELTKAGKQVIVVSSGAIALGRHVLGLPRGELPLEQSQAAAAVGQISLASAYQAILKSHGLTAAQILLTLGDTEERRRYLNARQTIATLLAQQAVPVVNENDTVATSEIRYGDNDRLSARVASMMSADCLVLLSDIDGLYTAPPGEQRQRHAPRRGAPDHARDRGHGRQRRHRALARRHGDQDRGRPHRARVRHQHGHHLGQGAASPARARAKARRAPGSWRRPIRSTARKRWIAGQLEPKGIVEIDAGAEKALLSGKSLLPAGVRKVQGAFERGDAVIIRAADGRELGRGLVAYARDDAARIIGRKSGEIAAILGHAGRTELVHRDDMVLSKA